MASNNSTKSELDRKLLSEAALSASRIAGLGNNALAQILGVSDNVVIEIEEGQYLVNPDRGEWARAVMVVDMFRRLHTICAEDESVIRKWLENENNDLGGSPITIIQEKGGLDRVVEYLHSI